MPLTTLSKEAATPKNWTILSTRPLAGPSTRRMYRPDWGVAIILSGFYKARFPNLDFGSNNIHVSRGTRLVSTLTKNQLGFRLQCDLTEFEEPRELAFQITILWLVLNVNDPPDGDIADVGDIGGGGHDDGDGVDKWQEELLPTTEVLMHIISKGKNRNKHSHGGKYKANCETTKTWVAILEQPQSVQDVTDEVEQREYQLYGKS